MFTVWPDTATLDTTPALPSPWSYSQIKQFFSLASRTAWNWVSADWLCASTRYTTTEPMAGWRVLDLRQLTGTIPTYLCQQRHYRSKSRTEYWKSDRRGIKEAETWQENVFVCLCARLCVHAWTLLLLKKQIYGILDMYLRININVLGLAPCITIHPHRVWLHHFGSPENPAYVSECRNAFVKIKPHTVSLKLNTLQLHTKVYLMYHRKHLLCLWFF